jgi:predicted flap endonuclease-1-like 5' DNA nuclease
MNDTASAGGATGASLLPDGTDAFTIAHLAVLAVFALLVIAAIVWGARLKARRKAAERHIASHNEDVVAAAPEARVEAPPVARRAEDMTPVATARDPLADEPIAAAAPLDAAPAVEAVSAPAPAPAPISAPAPAGESPADAPVGTLKGLGPKLTARLAELGITTVGQVAALSDDEAMRLDAQLGPFAGRITRDRWIEQARFLAAGDPAGFEAVFGRLTRISRPVARSSSAQVVTASTFTLPSAPVNRTWRSKRAPLGGSGTQVSPVTVSPAATLPR